VVVEQEGAVEPRSVYEYRRRQGEQNDPKGSFQIRRSRLGAFASLSSARRWNLSFPAVLFAGRTPYGIIFSRFAQTNRITELIPTRRIG